MNHNPNYYHLYTGAFAKGTIGVQPISGISDGITWAEGWGIVTEYFDASRSSTIYGNSGTVTPLSESTLMLIKY